MSNETRNLRPRTFVTLKRLILSPGQQDFIRSVGNFLVCVTATHAFKLGLDQGSEMMDWNLGLKFRLVPGEYFTALAVQNPHETDTLLVEFLIGEGDIDDARLNVVRESGMPYKGVETIILAHDEHDLAMNGTIVCPGDGAVGSGRGYRKEILVTNLDPSNDLDVIQTSTGKSIGMVLARTAWCLETSEDLTVKNPNASTMALRVSETFYLEG